MRQIFVCRLIFNTNKEKKFQNLFNNFVDKVFLGVPISERTHQRYWKDPNKILCEFNFIIEASSNELFLKSYLILLLKISNIWDINFASQIRSDLIINSAVCQNTNIVGIDWINIETK